MCWWLSALRSSLLAPVWLWQQRQWGHFGVIFSKFLRTIVNSYSAYACGALTHCLLMNLQNHAPCCLVLQEYLASLTAFCGEILWRCVDRFPFIEHFIDTKQNKEIRETLFSPEEIMLIMSCHTSKLPHDFLVCNAKLTILLSAVIWIGQGMVGQKQVQLA